MKRIGIIALEEERISKLKWYVPKRWKIAEKFYLNSYDAEAFAIYADRNINNIHKMLINNDISIAVCTEKFIEKIGQISLEGIKITTGCSLYSKLVPKIIKKTIKISGIETDKGTLAISEENPEIALSLVEKLCNDFRFITIISKNKKKACEISDIILDNYGLPIVVADSDSKIRCDIAVKTGGDIPNLSKNTILIDASTEHTITRKNTINWVDVNSNHNLPYKIDSLSFAEGIELLTGSEFNFNISSFRCGKNCITTQMLSKSC